MRLFDLAKRRNKTRRGSPGLQGRRSFSWESNTTRKVITPAQLEIIKALHKSGTPMAVALEMFRHR